MIRKILSSQLRINMASGVAGILNQRCLGTLASRRFHRLGREFLWIGLGQAAAVVGALVGIRILTGLLTREAYGQLALGMTAATLINQTLLGPLANAATRFFAPAREAGTLRDYSTAVRRLVLQATGVVCVISLLLCLGFLLLGKSRWVGLTAAAVIFAVLSGHNSVLNGVQNAARQRAIVALHQGLLSWGRFLLAAALVVWLGVHSAVAMMGYAVATLLVLGSQAWFFRCTLQEGTVGSEFDDAAAGRWKSEILAYSWPFAVWGIPAWMQLASDRWALQLFSSTENVGLYAVLCQLGYYPITILTELAVQMVYPIFFQRAGDGLDAARVRHVYRLNRKLTLAALLLAVGATVTACLLHRAVFTLVVAPAYHAVSWMLPGMVLAGGCFATAQFAVVSLLSGSQTRSLILPKVVIAALGVVLNICGAAWWGIIGVVIASVTAAAAYLIWVLCLVESRYRQVKPLVAP